MTAPTVAQVRRYLLHSDWKPGEACNGGTVWWQTPGGAHVVIPHWPDDDTRLLERTSVLHVIATVTGRTLKQAAADVTVDQEDFWGCTRGCWPLSRPPADWTHTRRWGDCEKAEKPPTQPAHFDIPVTRTAEDGYPAVGWKSVSVSVALFAPWVEYLPPEDQHTMLAEVAMAKPDERAKVIADWRRAVEQLADPLQRKVLLGDHDPANFVEAPRPDGIAAKIPSRAEIEAGVVDV